MEQKTNAMRRLDAAKIPYIAHSLGSDEPMSATELAHKLNKEEGRVFKTLVTEGKSGAHYVFVIPSNTELDLKKAARAAGEKSISMLLQKNLLPLTGYVHGGCSPIGMKKLFPTFLHESAKGFDTIFFSAGRIGCQIETSPDGLLKVVPYKLCDLTV